MGTTVTESESWRAAKSEGLAYFWAHMHVGRTIHFVGHNWEDGGFPVNEDGNPIADANGNSVANFVVEELDPKNQSHVDDVAEWYG